VRKKIWAIICGLIASIFLLSSCSAFSTPKVSRPPLRIEWSIWEGDYTLLIAKEKGFFKKHGLDVELVVYDTYTKAIPDMAGRVIDGGLFSLGDLLVLSRIAEVKGVMAYDSGGSTKVVALSSIQKMSDLKGKRVGLKLGTYAEMDFDLLLKREGLSLRDITPVEIDPELVPQALTSGLIDAGYIYSPYDQEAIARGHHLIYLGMDNDLLLPDMVVFNRAVIEDRPEDIQAFVDAWFEALEYRKTHAQECDEIIARLTNQTVADVALTGDVELYDLQKNREFFAEEDGKVSAIYRIALNNLDFMVSRGRITIRPDLSQLLDASFIK
jgi:NitT/TauT family transport system substrate-binding protein